MKEAFADAADSYTIKEFVFEELENPAKPLMSKYKIESEQELSGDLIYIDAVLEKAFDENPFKDEQRVYPVDFAHPFSNRYVYNLTIPTGYQVEELPAKLVMALPNDGGKFTFLTTQINNVIQVNYTLIIGKAMFLPDEYPALKSFFEQAIAKLSEQVVLKKVSK
ncbi:MAG: DUF3858 domain-containing protein [Microscillaceae bacterium]|nr:DUF3858 domain-containing protein [Microscillaceae bacterium]